MQNRFILKTLFISLMFVFGQNCFAQNSGSAERQRVPLADPFILYHNDKYYAYGTSDPDGIAVYTSNDLKSWTKEQNLALHKDDSYGDRWFWAPEVYYFNKKFYMYYSADEHICIATSDSPAGPFKQDAKQPMLKGKAIDNSLFIDDDGKIYLFFVRFTEKGNEIWLAEMENDYKTIKTNTLHACIHAIQDWEKSLPLVNEGPFVVKHKGIYYMTYSANDFRNQDYGIGVATATNLTGDWEKSALNPVLQRPAGLVGTGHHCLFYDKNGGLLMAFHAHKNAKSVHRREMYITKVEFVPDVASGKDNLTVEAEYQTTYVK